MVHPKVLAGAPYRSSRARGVLLGLAGLGLGLGGIGVVVAVLLLVSAVFPPALGVLVSLVVVGLVFGAQVLMMLMPALGLVGLVALLSRRLR